MAPFFFFFKEMAQAFFPFLSSSPKHLEDALLVFWCPFSGEKVLMFTHRNGSRELDPRCPVRIPVVG